MTYTRGHTAAYLNAQRRQRRSSSGGLSPTLLLSSTSIDEDASTGTVVGTLSVIDLPDGVTVSGYSITADPDSKFDISSDDLITDATLDYETATSHSVTIRATLSEGDPIDRIFSISVVDVAEPPAQFATDDWSVADAEADDGDEITITITDLPDEGDASITDIEYQIDGGSWVSLGDTALTDYSVTGLTPDAEVDVAIRAVSASGNGTASATKAVTPTDGGYGDDFVFVWETTGSNETLTIGADDIGTFNAEIDWGDGSTSTITAYDDADLSHEYADADEYTVRVSGTFPNCHFYNENSEQSITSVLQLGDVGWLYLASLLRDTGNVTDFTVGNTDASAVTTANRMFLNAGLTSVDLDGLNLKADCDVSFMLQGNDFTSVDISNMPFPDETNLTSLFRSCSNLVTITGLDTIVQDTGGGSLQLIGSFQDCPELVLGNELAGWDVSRISNATLLLSGSNKALTTAQYDAILIAWAAGSPQSGVSIHFGDATYTSGGAAEAARTTLVTTYSWTIVDGGAA